MVHVCGISSYEYTAGTFDDVWFMCVGSVCMRSTQQERVWFMCVGSVCMRSTQQGHAQYGLYVLDQSV